MANADDSENTPSWDHPLAGESSSKNSDAVEICAGCHQPLVRRGPKGECLRCLMDFAFSADEETPSAGSVGAEPFGKGTPRRYGHFDIDTEPDGYPVELGAGAMATTYRALDSVLHSAVALKVINQAVAAHPTTRARFLREARAAAKLHHPNVARVSHYGEQNGECYYVMELVEGETLEERVRREGPLPPALALEIGVQVARALAAAEACGVMHRDLKPSNIMLTIPQGEKTSGASTVVKVIDWGLAKALSAESALGADHTQGAFVGTPAFASPEQFSPTAIRRLDTRSDIYSLGVTLWYLLCARTPFMGSTLEEIHARQTQNPLPLEQLSAARVPGRVVTLLKSMLAVDPAARPQSARELIESLRSCQERFPFDAVPRHLRRRRFRRIAIVVGGFLASAACVMIGWNHAHHLPSTPENRSIAVLPLENLSEDKDNAFFADGIQDDVIASLAKIRDLRVLSRSSVMSYRNPATRPDPREIGQRLGVAYLLEGSVRRAGSRVRVSTHLVGTRDDRQIWAETYDREIADALTLQGELARDIATALHATLSPEEEARVSSPPTLNPDAYVLYLRARDIISKPNIDLADLREQERLYGQAVTLDPRFALAYAYLAEARYNIAFNYEPTAARYAGAREAAERALQLQPDLGVAHLAIGSCYQGIDHDLARALKSFETAAHLLPNSAKPQIYIGAIQGRRGHWTEAREAYLRGIMLEPPDGYVLARLARLYFNQRDWSAAAATYDRAIALAPNSFESRLYRAYVDFHARGDLTRMRATVLPPLAEPNPEGEFTVGRYDLALLEGNYAEAERVLDGSTLTTFPVLLGSPLHADFLRGLIYLARRGDGDAERARKHFEKARAHYEDGARQYPSQPLYHVDLGVLYGALGWRDAALAEGSYAVQFSHDLGDVRIDSAVTLRLTRMYALLGDADNAFPLLEKLFSMPVDEWNGFSQYDLRLRPEWAALRKDSRYQPLIDKVALNQPAK